jgi:predicted Zn-dependent protease
VVEVDNILEYADKMGAQDAEVVSEHSQFTHTKFELGEPKQISSGKMTEYALRVVVDNAVGFSYFTGDWKSAVKEAITLAKTREKDERWRSFACEKPEKSLDLYRKSVVDTPIEKVISDINAACDKTKDKKIVASNIEYQMGCYTAEIANSTGVHKRYKKSFSMARVMCRAADTDYGMGYAYNYSLGYDLDLLTLAERAKEKALNQLGKQKTESGEKQIILAPKVFSNLLICAGIPSFLGHNVVEGRSALTIGDNVAADHVVITENPVVEGIQGRTIDDEGVPSHPVTLIQGKKVNHFLYDTYYGDTTSSGIRYRRYRGKTLRDPPNPCATSLVVTGNSGPLDEIISCVKDGVLVLEETNSHASKAQSGLFSVAVTAGFIIKNGKITSPVKRCMISGLAFEDLLPNIVLISKERELHRSFVYPTYVETGHVLVDSLRVTA